MLRRIVVKVLRALVVLRAQVLAMVLAFPVGVVVARVAGHDVGSPMFASIIVPVMIVGAALGTVWARRRLDRPVAAPPQATRRRS